MGNIRSNLYGHTSREELLYGNRSREAVLYDERIKDRQSSGRLRAMGKMLLNKMGESIVSAFPDAQGDSIPASLYNGLKSGLKTSLSAEKHKYGKAAFKNDIPGTKRVVQNFWSLYHLKDGLTTIDSFYTVEHGGNEYVLAIQKDDEPMQINSIIQAAEGISGNEREYAMNHENVVNGAIDYSDWNAEQANVYAELTDEDSLKKDFVEITSLKPAYMKGELAFIGARGKRTLVGQTSSGDNVYRYEKPSANEFMKYYTKMDLYYTAVTTTAKAAEKVLGGMAGQDIYKREAKRSIKMTLGNYIPHGPNESIAGYRDDGIPNPIQLRLSM